MSYSMKSRIRGIIREEIDKILQESNENVFVPTVEWMKMKYDEYNALCFGNKLPKCVLKIGPLSGFLMGSFVLASRKSVLRSTIMYDAESRKEGKWGVYHDSKKDRYIPITNSNIYTIFRPTIVLSTKFSSSEDVFENTLVHEMCHYFQFINNGDINVDNEYHGNDFDEIAEMIYRKTNGKLKITATSDELSQDSVSEDWVNKSGKYAVVCRKNNMDLGILLSSDQSLKYELSKYSDEWDGYEFYISYDPKLISRLIMHRFPSVRSYGFYNFFPGFNFNDYNFKLMSLNDFNGKLVYQNPKAVSYVVHRGNDPSDRFIIFMSNEKEAERCINLFNWGVLAKSKDPHVINELFNEFGKPSGSIKSGMFKYDEKLGNMIQNGV